MPRVRINGESYEVPREVAELVNSLDANLRNARSDEAIRDAAADRMQLLRDATIVLDCEPEELRRLDARTIRIRTIQKARPNIRLDGKSDEYLEGVFDEVVADHADASRQDMFRRLAPQFAKPGDGVGLVEKHKRMVEDHLGSIS